MDCDDRVWYNQEFDFSALSKNLVMDCDNKGTVRLEKPILDNKGGLIYSVPYNCGKCYNCKQRRVAQWSFRLKKELEVSTSAYFITLTYDNDHVPITKGKFPMTLKKKDLQDFFKRLRYYEKQNRIIFNRRTKTLDKQQPIKYYACGEYGHLHSRPHMHIIAFNIVSEKSIRESWTYGSVDIQSEVNTKNIEYTLKYINKLSKVSKKEGDYRTAEFALMSKGLGKSFLQENIKSFYSKRLDINYVVNDNGVKIAMPKYFREKVLNEKAKKEQCAIIKKSMEEAEEKERALFARKKISYDNSKQMAKFGRQQKMKNYSLRNID